MVSILSKLVEPKPALKLVQVKLFRKGLKSGQRASDTRRLACSLEAKNGK